MPALKNSTMSFGAPYDVTWRNYDFKFHTPDEKRTDFHMLFTDYRFAETFGLELLREGIYLIRRLGLRYQDIICRKF